MNVVKIQENGEIFIGKTRQFGYNQYARKKSGKIIKYIDINKQMFYNIQQ